MPLIAAEELTLSGVAYFANTIQVVENGAAIQHLKTMWYRP